MLPILPDFDTIDTAAIVSNIQQYISQYKAEIAPYLETQPSWIELLHFLEDSDDRLERLFSPLAHLHAVANNAELRKHYEAGTQLLTEFHTELAQHQGIYQIWATVDPQTLSDTEQKILHDGLLSFRQAGVHLPEEDQRTVRTLDMQLSTFETQFENHVMDAELAFKYHSAEPIAGLPVQALAAAQARTDTGYLFTLEYPCYLAIMTYAEDSHIREHFYHAYVTRASDQGPQASLFDNTAAMQKILSLRQQKAHLLGWKNFADYALAPRMANSSQEVLDFLQSLLKLSHTQAQKEYQALEAFAQQKLHAWDIAYWSEKKRQATYQISQEALRPYFPLPKVLQGFYQIIKTLFGIRFEPVSTSTWHPDVQCLAAYDQNNQLRGYIYLDLFARPHKRSGAWMDSLQSRRKLPDQTIQYPIATLTCNFTAPSPGETATCLHDEVLTLFHEFGHCLHHVLTQVDFVSVSGIHGVAWDAVELPSQLLEYWGWEEASLRLCTEHLQTGEPLPSDVLQKLKKTKQHQSAMYLLRQLELALFDFQLHENYNDAHPEYIYQHLKKLQTQTALSPIPSYNRFAHSFSHIFAGGYAAGYYSYLWAEVLASDVFDKFEIDGLFNTETGLSLLHNILEVGGAVPAQKAFFAFRKRSATLTAFLRHHGIG
ncbi:MAG: M3 family metallopeptidase [Legionellaceae bacterium]|nr:M3 family metallopeptidase [Legionellaceae bacterium]